MIDKVLTSVKKETDRQYFFSKLNNPLWLDSLRQRGYFSNPPGMKKLPDGYVQYPHWPESGYLVNIANEATDSIIDIVLSFPKTDNPRVYEDIFSIALKLDGEQSVRLFPKLNEYIELDNQFLAHRYPELLLHWSEQGKVKQALELAKLLVLFKEDPESKRKHQLRKKNPNSIGTSLEPLPQFGEWEYQQILETGVRPIINHKPLQAAKLLIEAVVTMIQFGIHSEDIKKGRSEDYSEIWCRRMDKPDRDYQTVKEVLVHTLTYACEKVYEKEPDSSATLDQELRKPHWKLFTRLRQHLYSLFPNDQSLPWIRQQIIEHDTYSKWDLHYEFQLMIRKSCERFGNDLLSEAELKDILDDILKGPSKKDFQEWLGEKYTEDAFKKRQHYFHRIQLRPFSLLLNNEVREYFDELEAEGQAESIEDDSYAPHGDIKGGTISYQSPKSIKDFENLCDEDLLAYLNNWNEEQRDKDNWLIEINISALANVFQSFFKEKIVQDKTRLTFWMENRARIERPIYIAAMLKAIGELIKNNNFSNLEDWIQFSKWVLSLVNDERVEGKPEPSDESRNNPDWSSSHRAVLDFIDTCFKKEVNTPIEAREYFKVLLQLICNLPDWRLDQGQLVLLSSDDPITEAINNTRSRALESLIHFGFWIRRHLPKDNLQEITDIIDMRIDNIDTPLTRPEKALIGMQYSNLCTFNKEWAAEHVETFFPQEKSDDWNNAFGSFIRYNRPNTQTFEVLNREYEYAINNLSVLSPNDEGNINKELINKLGQHIFTYYLWDVYSLSGEDSLLKLFYVNTEETRTYWGQLFSHVGRLLRNSGNHLNNELTNRITAFFDWRYDIGEPLELQEFTFWLEAECLDPSWRLNAYSKILDHKQVKGNLLSLQVRALKKLSSNHLALTLECFAKITDAMNQGTQMYIRADDAKGMMKIGLESDDSQVVENTKRARENLLRLGRLDYMDV